MTRAGVFGGLGAPRGKPIEDLSALEKAENVLIVDPTDAPAAINRAVVAEEDSK